MLKKIMNGTNQKSSLRWFLLLWLGLIYIQGLQNQSLQAVTQNLSPGIKAASDTGSSFQFTIASFTILMAFHCGLHWIAFSLKKNRDLLLYFLGQGILVLLICFLAHMSDSVFYLCLVLPIEAVMFFKQTRLIILVIGSSLLLFVFAEGAQIAPSIAVASSNLSTSLHKLSSALTDGLTLMLFVTACMMLYVQQSQAHRRDQAVLSELETTHAQLKTVHEQLAAAHSQLEEYAAQVEDLTLIAERQRLARELHDTLAQSLVGLTMQLETIDALLLKQRCSLARDVVQQAMTQARATMTQARSAIENLRAERQPHFSQLVQSEIQRFTSATGIICNCSLPETLALPSAFHEHLLRLITEGLMNIARHAQATRAWICGTCDQHMLTLEIGDDGIGFDPMIVARQSGHYGLLGLRERARLLQGQLSILSAPGKGTTIRLQLSAENGAANNEQ